MKNKKGIFVIIFLGVIVFFNSLFNKFVLDDKSYIIFNSELHSLNFSTLIGKNVFNSNITGQYNPVSAIYFAILYFLFGNNPFFYHLFQVAIHILNAILVFLLLKKFLKDKLSLFLSLIFLIHPIQTEAVNYITAVSHPLFFLFGIISLLVSLKDRVDVKRLALIFSLLFLSILSKEAGILFIIIILFYRILFKKSQILTFSILSITVFFFYLLLRIGVAQIYLVKSILVPIANLPLVDRLANIPAIFFYYLKTVALPSNLATLQLWVVKKLDFNNFYLPLLVDSLFFLLLLVCIHIFKENKVNFHIFLFFFVWFAIGIILHLQIFPIDFTVEDRFFYFPMVGLLGIMGVGTKYLKFSSKSLTRICYATAIIILLILSIRTIVRNMDWFDGMTLLNHDSKISNNFMIENDLGSEYGYLQDYNQAINHYKMSIGMFPFDGNLYDLAFIYDQTKNIEKAKEYYYKALDQKYSIPSVHKHKVGIYLGLAKILFFYDDPITAKNFIKTALNDYPDSAKLWILLALSENKLQNQIEALHAAEKAKTLMPNDQTNYLYLQIQKGQSIEVTP